MVTNVSELEPFLLELEGQYGQKIAMAADVPVSLAVEALEDLRYMGLSAATMFPGLDGVCGMMRHEMAFKRPNIPTAGKPLGDVVDKVAALEQQTHGAKITSSFSIDQVPSN